MKKSVFLDYAAATPLEPRVLEAMRPYFTEKFFNPSALYLDARGVKKDLNEARSLVSNLIAVRPTEIIFTAGGSEANNLAIRGIMESFPGKKLLISAVEHESVRAASELYKVKEIKVDAYGRLDLKDLSRKIDDDTVLVSVIYASNEVGTIQDLSAITNLVKSVKADRKKRGMDAPIFLHTDATQATLFLNVSPKALGVDLMTLNGGKIYGPKQSGALFVRSGISLAPIIYGGGQEKNLRSGTENIPSIVGFSVALEIAVASAKVESKRLSEIRDKLRVQIEERIDGVIFHGHPNKRLPNHLSFALPGYDNERLMMELDELGFMVATGSACSASSFEASHVLTSMGVSSETARSTLRVTLGRQTTEKDIQTFLKALASLCVK